MADLTDEEASQYVKITGGDEIYTADVTLDDGKRKLHTLSTVSVGVGLGRDPIPDTYFTLDAAGAIGDTVRIQIAGTSNDSTSPDRDVPAVDYTYTLVAEDVGDEIKLAQNIVLGLNADVNFGLALLESAHVNDTRAIVHISSTGFSLEGEFLERSNALDVQVTPTGTTLTTLAFDTLIARAKQTTLSRDPNNPHRAGILGMSGNIVVSAQEVDNLIEEFATATGPITDLTVDGSVTPVVFSVYANSAGGGDKVLDSITMYGTDTNIKVGEFNFLGNNSPLTNGILIETLIDGVLGTFRVLKSTNDVLARMSSGPSDNKIINQSGGDYIQAIFSLVEKNLQVVLSEGTTDEVRVTVQDDVTQVTDLFVKVEGFLRD